MDAYYAANEWLTAHASSSGSESEPPASWTVTIKAGTQQVHLVDENEDLIVNYQVNDIVGETKNGTYDGIPVVAFWKAG